MYIDSYKIILYIKYIKYIYLNMYDKKRGIKKEWSK